MYVNLSLQSNKLGYKRPLSLSLLGPVRIYSILGGFKQSSPQHRRGLVLTAQVDWAYWLLSTTQYGTQLFSMPGRDHVELSLDLNNHTRS